MLWWVVARSQVDKVARINSSTQLDSGRTTETVDRGVSPTPSGISDWLTGLSTWWSQLERCLGKRCSTRASSAVFNSRSVVPCPVHNLTAKYAMNYNIIVLENWTLKMDRQIVYESDCIWGGRSDFKWTGTEMERDRDRRIGRDDSLNRINKNIYKWTRDPVVWSGQTKQISLESWLTDWTRVYTIMGHGCTNIGMTIHWHCGQCWISISLILSWLLFVFFFWTPIGGHHRVSYIILSVTKIYLRDISLIASSVQSILVQGPQQERKKYSGRRRTPQKLSKG